MKRNIIPLVGMFDPHHQLLIGVAVFLTPCLQKRQKKRIMKLFRQKKSLSWFPLVVCFTAHALVLFRLVLGEALFLLDSSAVTCPSQLQVTNHGLSVKNTMNKKWSTIRSTVRLSSGIHRWEVVIDR